MKWPHVISSSYNRYMVFLLNRIYYIFIKFYNIHNSFDDVLLEPFCGQEAQHRITYILYYLYNPYSDMWLKKSVNRMIE